MYACLCLSERFGADRWTSNPSKTIKVPGIKRIGWTCIFNLAYLRSTQNWVKRLIITQECSQEILEHEINFYSVLFNGELMHRWYFQLPKFLRTFLKKRYLKIISYSWKQDKEYICNLDVGKIRMRGASFLPICLNSRWLKISVQSKLVFNRCRWNMISPKLKNSGHRKIWTNS